MVKKLFIELLYYPSNVHRISGNYSLTFMIFISYSFFSWLSWLEIYQFYWSFKRARFSFCWFSLLFLFSMSMISPLIFIISVFLDLSFFFLTILFSNTLTTALLNLFSNFYQIAVFTFFFLSLKKDLFLKSPILEHSSSYTQLSLCWRLSNLFLKFWLPF